MRNRSLVLFAALCSCHALALAATPAAEPVDEAMLQRLYRLLRPAATHKTSLSEMLAKATQRAGVAKILPRVLIVNVRSGVAIEWAGGRGAVEPSMCPDGRWLTVRRGNALQLAAVGSAPDGQPVVAAPQVLSGIEVRQLFGCTFAPEGGAGYMLWVEQAPGTVDALRLLPAAQQATPDAPHMDTPLAGGVALRRLQGMRGDGLRASVRDMQLVVEAEVDRETQSRLVPLKMPVAGDPAWVGDGDWLVLTGLKD